MNTKKIAALRSTIAKLEQDLNTARTDFLVQRDALIKERVDRERAKQGPIGILERMEALHALADSNSALFAGIWLVRMLFIEVDCAPILMKVINGRTTYDRLVGYELAHAVQMHAAELDTKLGDREYTARRRTDERAVELHEHRLDLERRVRRSEDGYHAMR